MFPSHKNSGPQLVSFNPDFGSKIIHFFSVDGGLNVASLGCTDPLAINFDTLATTDDGSCQYCDISATIIQSGPTSSISCDGYIFGSLSSSYQIISTQISDFNTGQVLSNTNFGTGLCSGVYKFEFSDIENCTYTEIISLGNVFGCTDSTMTNYNQYANTDDGSCIPYIYGCTDPTQFNYDITANTDDGSCIPIIYGCADSTAYNFDSSSNTNDGSCLYCDLSVNLFSSNNSYGNCDGYALAAVNTFTIQLLIYGRQDLQIIIL